jgi:hypothetical protein
MRNADATASAVYPALAGFAFSVEASIFYAANPFKMHPYDMSSNVM